MADFTPITTQEQLDDIIGKRLSREREKFADYDTLKSKAADYDALKSKSDGYEKSLADVQKKLDDALAGSSKDKDTINEQAAKLKRYETDSAKTKIAHELGLPFELAARLSGDDEKSIRADAETLRKVIGKNNTAPLHRNESGGDDATSAGYKTMLAQMRGE